MFNQSEMEKRTQEENIPSLSIAVISSSGDIQTQAVGVLKYGAQENTMPESVFEAASLSKPVFAYVVLKLAERGVIDLDEPLYRQVSDGFGPPHLRSLEEYKALTPRNILSHQAGLPNWPSEKTEKGEMLGEKFIAQPNEHFNYSGFAYCFLMEVIEQKTGENFEDTARVVFDDLAMRNSSFYQPETGSVQAARLAVGHNAACVSDQASHFPKRSAKMLNGMPARVNPAASLFTTADDYAKFLIACTMDPYIKRHMFSTQIELATHDIKARQAGMSDGELQALRWGLGIGLQQNTDGSITAFHWGDCETFRNFAAVRLDNDILTQGIVVLSNSANGPAVFSAIVEPVVGDISPIANWLSMRENFNMHHTLEDAAFLKKEEGHASPPFRSNQ